MDIAGLLRGVYDVYEKMYIYRSLFVYDDGNYETMLKIRGCLQKDDHSICYLNDNVEKDVINSRRVYFIHVNDLHSLEQRCDADSISIIFSIGKYVHDKTTKTLGEKKLIFNISV